MGTDDTAAKLTTRRQRAGKYTLERDGEVVSTIERVRRDTWGIFSQDGEHRGNCYTKRDAVESAVHRLQQLGWDVALPPTTGKRGS